MRPLKQVQKDADKLDREQVRLGVKVVQIIREQEAVIEAANKGIERLNSDLGGLQHRLDPYTGKTPRKLDEAYFELKDRYTNKLHERAVLENARSLAEESITAAKLHMIPGEIERGPA